jgi:excisionase family DNA binding protein
MSLEVNGVELYSVKKVAEKLRSSKLTVRTYLKEGKIKGLKITGRWYIIGDNLDRYIKKIELNSRCRTR